LGRVRKYPEEFGGRRRCPSSTAAAVSGTSPGNSDVHCETLRDWVGALRRERAAPGRPVSGDERAESARLRRWVAERELEKGNDVDERTE
jgi:hypothetical protein